MIKAYTVTRIMRGGSKMAITLEKIDLIMDRAKVTYNEAKEALEKADGNVVDALIALEEKKKTKNNKRKWKSVKKDTLIYKMQQWILKVNAYKLSVSDKSKEYMSIPLVVASLIILFTFPLSILSLAILIILDYKVAIHNNEGEIIDINNMINGKKKDK